MCGLLQLSLYWDLTIDFNRWFVGWIWSIAFGAILVNTAFYGVPLLQL